jgi:hypothetical protein
VIIDAWMQHPSAEFLADPMFDSLRRWARGQLDGGEVPVEATVAATTRSGICSCTATPSASSGSPRASGRRIG